MRVLLAALILGALTACNAPVSTAVSGVTISQADDVKSCKFISDVHGASMFYGMFASGGIDSARKSAMEQTKTLGGNNIVWSSFDSVYGGSTANGAAYLCKE